MNSQFSNEILKRIEHCGVIAVLVISDVNDAVPVARSLIRGGVDIMELTLRTAAAVESLKIIRKEVPEMLAGIGTILTIEQVKEVVKAGASFGVSPGTNPHVIQAAKDAGLPFAPGIVTPSDIEKALELGCRELKFFPAETSGGLEYLKSMAAPYLHLGVRFIPLGGINTSVMNDYLLDPLILALGGSWLAPKKLIEQKNWQGIEKNAAEARKLVENIRLAGKK